MRYNVELKFQTTVEAENENEAYKKAKERLIENPDEAFPSHCKKVKGK
jgi:hypothetical protein